MSGRPIERRITLRFSNPVASYTVYRSERLRRMRAQGTLSTPSLRNRSPTPGTVRGTRLGRRVKSLRAGRCRNH